MNAIALALLFVAPPGPAGRVMRIPQQAVSSPWLRRECLAHRTSGSGGQAGSARFVPERANRRFEPRSAVLNRRVVCGFRQGTLVSATERFYLQIVSQDRDNPGFTTGGPNMSNRFYIVCEGSLGTTLQTFAPRQVLSFADNTFTLPCGHSVYPAGKRDPAEAHRITGVYTYKVRSATLEVRQGPTAERPEFDVAVDVLVENPIEALHLRGRVSGRLAMVYTIVNCPTRPRYTKQESHPGCP
jgi:hypothetical protein